MICKLTGIEGKGVDAHVIPKSFYNIDPEEKLPTKVYTNTQGRYSKRSPQGIYDKTILVEQGERMFSSWDDYGADILLNRKDKFEPLHQVNKLVGYQLANYDYNQLKLFCLSVLWRASVSSDVFFSKVNLCPHEAIIRNALLTNNSGEPEWYSVCIAKWSDFKNGLGMMDPFRERFDHVNYYRLYLESYVVYIKVDKAKTPKGILAIQLQPDSPLIITARELRASKELPIMINMAKHDAK
jgi:hypothetical protein